MHESGIAASILEIVSAEAARYPGMAIAGLRVRVGDFSNVVPEALAFAFDALKTGTPAAKAALEILTVPVSARCPRCCETITPEGPLFLWCAACGGPLEILTGQELQVESFDLEECDVEKCEVACSES